MTEEHSKSNDIKNDLDKIIDEFCSEEDFTKPSEFIDDIYAEVDKFKQEQSATDKTSTEGIDPMTAEIKIGSKISGFQQNLISSKAQNTQNTLDNFIRNLITKAQKQIEEFNHINKTDLQELIKDLYQHDKGIENFLLSINKGIGALFKKHKKNISPLTRKQLSALQLDLKNYITSFKQLFTQFIQEAEELLEYSYVNLSCPVREYTLSAPHPVSEMMEKITDVITNMGFSITEGPNVDNDENNFDLLNIPKTHPARTEQDTFFLDKVLSKNKEEIMTNLLRTHTSNTQNRILKLWKKHNEDNKSEEPLAVIIPGKVYRNDSDRTHTPMFHQIEGVYVSKTVNLLHLKGVITEILQKIFGDNTELRFRYSYFPFTEPSLEVDLKDINGEWLEIMGCGLIHPKILANAEICTKTYKGFAFGMGVERFAMIHSSFNDIRKFYNHDLLWLSKNKLKKTE